MTISYQKDFGRRTILNIVNWQLSVCVGERRSEAADAEKSSGKRTQRGSYRAESVLNRIFSSVPEVQVVRVFCEEMKQMPHQMMQQTSRSQQHEGAASCLQKQIERMKSDLVAQFIGVGTFGEFEEETEENVAPDDAADGGSGRSKSTSRYSKRQKLRIKAEMHLDGYASWRRYSR